jgi:hypothetical protein
LYIEVVSDLGGKTTIFIAKFLKRYLFGTFRVYISLKKRVVQINALVGPSIKLLVVSGQISTTCGVY